MSKPIWHAENSAKKFGGKPDDYIEIHDLMDETKSTHADMRHRLIFHSAYGIYLVEKILGHAITNSDGKMVAVRDVAEQHVLEDLGFIPSLDEWLKEVNMKPWMAGMRTRRMVLVD